MFLEDIAALYYHRQFIANYRGALSHRRGDRQADFILQIKAGNRLALEFGWGQKTARQLETTMKTIKCQYGLVFSNSTLELIDNKYVKVPLDYFFLT